MIYGKQLEKAYYFVLKGKNGSIRWEKKFPFITTIHKGNTNKVNLDLVFITSNSLIKLIII
ncbi:hypothetical protein [Bacillus sp. CHD6a]|uniref:hypothetical protein n=1 Tax=Bacillus sp. CHD6a TaxID=1643452 RepID=UPI0006CDBB21|nr:hypothetical protein [Bacillus sp. CHD6a]KPB04243.1 hypothetical protein AAV98_13415 [Bacillus sp. CHD6a]